MRIAKESPLSGNRSLMLEKDEITPLILENGLLMDTRQVEQWMACLEFACRCSDPKPDQRPTVKDGTQQLRQIERAELPPSSSSIFFNFFTARTTA